MGNRGMSNVYEIFCICRPKKESDRTECCKLKGIFLFTFLRVRRSSQHTSYL
jgi:hypothetical protein